MLDERFWSKTAPGPNGCLNWTACKSKAGYGFYKVRGRTKLAHRVAWEAENGEIPAELEIDHIVCDNTSCVNTAHMKLSTPRANVLRNSGPSAANARKTICLRGHPLSGANLRIDPTGRRICRTCKQIQCRIIRERKRLSRSTS